MTIAIISGSVTNINDMSVGGTYTVPAAVTGNRRVFFLVAAKQPSGTNMLSSLSLGSVAAGLHSQQNYYSGASNQVEIWSIKEADIPSGAQAVTCVSGNSGDEANVACTIVTLDDCYQGDTISATTIQIAFGSGTPNVGAISAALSTITAGMLILSSNMAASSSQGFTFSGDGGHALLGTSDRGATANNLRIAAGYATAADGNETVSARNNYQDASNPEVILAIAIAGAGGSPAATSMAPQSRWRRLTNQLMNFPRR